MDIAKLAVLKRKMQDETNFKSVWEYFLDNFGEDAEFLSYGEPVEHPVLEGIIKCITKELFPTRSATLAQLLLVRVIGQPFIHGGCIFGGKLGTILYFEDIEMGMISIVSASSQETQLIRFTAEMFKRSWEPSAN
jgi:hypothetical protein